MSDKDFDEHEWAKKISSPAWYLDYIQLAEEAKRTLGEDSDKFVKLRRRFRHFFEEQLTLNHVCLADSGPNLDEQRQPIDTLVIHHTSGSPGYRLSYMEATQLLNIYAPVYANPSASERGIKGQAIWSGHFRNGKQTFLAYHWLMRMDGTFERLLGDDKIGWHAGNWEINKKSIAICLDNNYENQDPTDETLRQLAQHIKKYYPGLQIIGHREARAGTTCPGGNFLGGWKDKLIKYLV